MLGDKLRSLRKQKGKTQGELAKQLNVTIGAISSYERNERFPMQDILKKYTEVFDVSYDYLLGESTSLKQGEDYTTINVLGSVPAGIPIEAIEDIQDSEDLSFKEYDKNKEYIGLKVTGDSMYPEYLEGDTIIIEKTPCFESGNDCVVYVNGYDATLKTVIKNDDGSITLRPKNPAYPPKTYTSADEPIEILGIVKEIRRKI